MAVTGKDVAWLAGLLEGEGCFTFCGNSVTVHMNMTDRDVIERSALFVKAPSVIMREGRNERCKPQYRWTLCGNRAVGLMMSIYSFMSTRRKARIRQLLSRWMERPARRSEIHACEHADRKHYAHGKCKRCHVRAWYLARPRERRYNQWRFVSMDGRRFTLNSMAQELAMNSGSLLVRLRRSGISPSVIAKGGDARNERSVDYSIV